MNSNSNPNLRTAFITIFLIVATELIGFGLLIPMLPLIASKLTSNILLIGVLMSAFSFAQFIAAPFWGSLSDRFGRKPILIISKTGTIISYIILAFSHNYTGFLISRLLDGFTGGNIATARAYIADVTPEKDRSKGMAVIGISFGLGFILGPALGGLLYGKETGHFYPALVAGGLSLIALLFTIFLLKEPERKTETISAPQLLARGYGLIRNPFIMTLSLAILLYMLSFSGFESTFSLYTFKFFSLGERSTSLVLTYAGLITLVVQGYISRKTIENYKKSIISGLFLTVIAFILLGTANTFWEMITAITLLPFGLGLINTFLPTFLSTSVDKTQQGAAMGIYEGLSSLGRIIGPLYAYSIITYHFRLFYGLTALILIAVIVMLAKTKRHAGTHA